MPDFVVGVNDGPVKCFTRANADPKSWITVRLRGRPGNPTAVGARVEVRFEDGRTRTGEARAGGGYLSQSPAGLTFGTGGRKVESIVVRWPDGKETRVEGAKGKTRYEVEQGQ